MSFDDLSKQFRFSRATYYRKRKKLKTLGNNRASTTVISKSPRRRVNLRKRGAVEIDLALKICSVPQVRRENPTCGKTKITIILKRDHDFRFSESTILNYLKDKGKITRSISAIRQNKKRNFKKHANALIYKRYRNRRICSSKLHDGN